MKRINIFLRKTPDNIMKDQDSIWKTLKDPIYVVSKIILVLIGISPIVSVYLISSYLGDYNAKMIGFSIFSNIASLGFIIIYSFALFGLYLLAIFALPTFFGYLYGQYLPYYDIDNLRKSICNTNKVNKEEKVGRRFKLIIKILILIFYIIILAIPYKYYQKYIITVIILVIYLLIDLLLVWIIPPIKEDKKVKWWGILYVFATYISSLLFLLFISISHKNILHKNFLFLSIYNIIYAIALFIIGVSYANRKKTNVEKQDDVYNIIRIIVVIIGTFVVGNFIFKFPFPKIAIGYSGLGNKKKVIFKLKPNTPPYLENQLISKPIPLQTKGIPPQTQKLFLLIQTYNNYYVEKCLKKLPKKTVAKKIDIIKLPKKYVTNIITKSP